MCGIIGYSGRRPAAPLLLDGLARLEYRGYDSAGLALVDAAGLTVYKRQGRLSVLKEAVKGKDLPQRTGIGHTRWATHGRPSDANAHPHVSRQGRYAVVHNGIIENYAALRAELEAEGVCFRSETDTEVVAHLLERGGEDDPIAAVRRTLPRLRGTYALGIVCADRPGELFAVCKASPLVIGLSEGEQFIASDVTALLPYTRRVLYPRDGDVVRLTPDSVTVWAEDGSAVERPVKTVDWEATAADKGDYSHYMLKEIHEQPAALRATLTPHLTADGVRLEELRGLYTDWRQVQRVVLVACGSAYHAGMIGKYQIESLAGLPVEVEVASEFRYRQPPLDRNTLTLVISQSGETADTLAALREARRRGSPVVAVVNVPGSTIARESDRVLYTLAGPEIAVATTKGYTTQVAMLGLFAVWLADARGRLQAATRIACTDALRLLPALAERALTCPGLAEAAAWLSRQETVWFIGRHTDYAVALEAALKLKEISYIHAEAYAAGELKHGTISLIEEGTPVVALACREELREKLLSNLREVRTRGAQMLTVTAESAAADFSGEGAVLAVPAAPALTAPVAEVIPLQLLSYHVARLRGCDIDKPRNLAKSVTVE